MYFNLVAGSRDEYLLMLPRSARKLINAKTSDAKISDNTPLKACLDDGGITRLNPFFRNRR